MSTPDRNSRILSRRGVVRAGIGAALSCGLPRLVQAAADAPPLFRTARGDQFVILQPVERMPPLGVSSMDGRPVTLAPAPDRITLLHFWATWCPACRTELPALERFHAQAGPNVRLVTVATDGEGRVRVTPFLHSLGLTRLPVYLDPNGHSWTIGADESDGSSTPFVLYGLPITFVVAPSGGIEGYVKGNADWTTDAGQRLLDYYARR